MNAPTATMRKGLAPPLLAVAAAALVFVLVALAGPWSPVRQSSGSPITVGGYVTSYTDDETLLLNVTGPTGPGKLSGSTLTLRARPDTQFGRGLGRGVRIGPSVPIEAVIDGNANADGSYNLIRLDTQVR